MKIYTLLNRNDAIHLGIFSTKQKALNYLNKFPEEIRITLYVHEEKLDSPWSAHYVPLFKKLKAEKIKEQKRKEKELKQFKKQLEKKWKQES